MEAIDICLYVFLYLLGGSIVLACVVKIPPHGCARYDAMCFFTWPFVVVGVVFLVTACAVYAVITDKYLWEDR